MNVLNNRIIVKDVLSEDLLLRDVVGNLFKRINLVKSKEVILDFKGVKSISRSFAQEYLNNKITLSKKLKEENVSLNLKKMFHVVNNSKPRTTLKLKSVSLVL